MTRTVKVLLCDDSGFVRTALRQILEPDPGIHIVGEASDPYEAKDLIPKVKPDMIILDLEMPRMDGLTFLKVLMKKWPLPVLVFSSLSTRSSDLAYKALQLGAMDVLAKPTSGGSALAHLEPKIKQIVKTLGNVGMRTNQQREELLKRRLTSIPDRDWPEPASDTVCLLGASTGGTEALRSIISHLPVNFPPTCIAQHIPPVFSHAFAKHLNEITPLTVKEAQHGDRCDQGTILIAPGDHHMILRQDRRGYYVSLNQAAPVWHQRPAVEVLFRSATRCQPAKTIAGILTGMGSDGGHGLKQLRDAGARTFGQSKDSCVVYGMPRVAEELGACENMVDLEDIPIYLQRLLAHPVSVPA